MEIDFCGNNDGAVRICRELQRDFPQQRFKIRPCLNNCAICNRAPLALVDGILVTAGSWPELRRQLRSMLG